MKRVFIDRVHPGSEAEKAGLQAGDEVQKFDGVAVKELGSSPAPDRPLGRLLDRKPGDEVRFEIAAVRPKIVTLRAQRGRPWHAR